MKSNNYPRQAAIKFLTFMHTQHNFSSRIFFPTQFFFSKLNSSAPSRAGADENLNINSMWPKIASFHWQRQKCSFIRIVFSHKSTAEWMEYDLFGFTCQLLTLSPLSRISSALAPLTVQCTAIFSFLLMPKDLTV